VKYGCASVAILLAIAAGVSCRSVAVRAVQPGPQIVQPGAPGDASRIISVDKATDLSQVQFTGDDIKFMQGMIGHHAQALEMTALARSHSRSDDLKKMALRIEISQLDEIKMMERWLEIHRQQVPGRDAMHEHGATLMPGMLTEAEMSRLAGAIGVAFDRLFLQGMIQHHTGALTMVKNLFDTPGAGQDAEIFAFAAEVDADQRIEIDRMGAMLTDLGGIQP
jgi:uncharacterized protein (DUF305 family)